MKLKIKNIKIWQKKISGGAVIKIFRKKEAEKVLQKTEKETV